MEIKRRNSSHKVNGNRIVRDLGFLSFLAKKNLVCTVLYCRCLFIIASLAYFMHFSTAYSLLHSNFTVSEDAGMEP
jgi:hypothetical protein